MEYATDVGSMPPGTIILTDASRKAVVLHPTPSNDPNDPLNWSPLRKTVNFGLVCIYTLFTFVILDIGSVAYLQLVEEFGYTYQQSNIATAANYAALAIGCVFFIPFVFRFGRRPVYLVSLVLQLVSVIWFATARSTWEVIVSNIVGGLGGAINETIVQVSIADLFFVHQYATMNGIFIFMQGVGAFLGPTAAGYVVESQGWRWMWWWCTIFMGITFILVIFFFEESTYIPALNGERLGSNIVREEQPYQPGKKDSSQVSSEVAPSVVEPLVDMDIPRKSLRGRLALYTDTGVPVAKHVYIPFMVLIKFPAVFYAAITYGSILAWFAVLISISSAVMVYPPYNFGSAAIGLLNIAPFVGTLLASAIVPFMSDWIIVKQARRNGGIYEPEMRLWPALAGSVFVAGGILMFGVGIAHV